MATRYFNCDLIFDEIEGREGNIFDVYTQLILQNTSPHIKIKNIRMGACVVYGELFPEAWEIRKRHRNNIVPPSKDYTYTWCYCDIEVEILQTIITGDVFTFLEDCLKDNSTKKILYAGINAIYHDEDEMGRLSHHYRTEKAAAEEEEQQRMKKKRKSSN